ncbi:bone morphogenetic protein 5/6/7/8 [Clonorchis sinensis]|uniref:Bone morphogenetic protein 5/6/7/8 n=1 Tax=Clonorchis sinensis TaxID=79923 RepID=G7YJF9_CLOSI|nr:bone morphogenetic protein 5/6/7/8 [Clonorchis sinensis]
MFWQLPRGRCVTILLLTGMIAFVTATTGYNINAHKWNTYRKYRLQDRNPEDKYFTFVPEYMIRLYQRTTDNVGRHEGNIPFNADTVMSLQPKGPVIQVENNRVLRFKINRLPQTSKILAAELHYLHSPCQEIQCNHSGKKGGRSPRYLHFNFHQSVANQPLQFIGSRRIITRPNKWVVIELNSLLTSSSEAQIKFSVTLSPPAKCYMQPVSRRCTQSSFFRQKGPFMVIYLREEHHSIQTLSTPRNAVFNLGSDITGSVHLRTIVQNLNKSNEQVDKRKELQKNSEPVYQQKLQRSRRTLPNQRRQRHQGVCSIHSMPVNFEKIGWTHWVIAPSEYDARMCVGQCPFPLGQTFHPTNHAVIQLLVHHLKPNGLSVRRPCCVPRKMDPLHILYYDDEHNVILKQMEDMIVNTCGCA